MRSLISVLIAGLCLSVTGCGHYPAPIRSARDINLTPASEDMVVVVSLPLEAWPRLGKFSGLQHFRVAGEMAPEVTDNHVRALSRLSLPRLRQVSLAHCQQVTDDGLRALTNIPSLQGLQLIGTSITDRGMLILAQEFPRLQGINLEKCKLVTVRGFLSLTNSTTITDVSLSLDPFSQAQIENIISTVSNVTRWIISDPRHRLDQARLRELGASRKITLQVADENNFVQGITTAQPNGAANRSQPVQLGTNPTLLPAGSGR
jgi:hypothetical protein